MDTNSNPQPIPVHQEWTTSAFMENRRKFNIDLAPKIMFSRGSLVELLITSNIARYAEFQCITRILVYTNGHIEQVPCSRADVFSTENVNLVEKRMLMKFMNFCSKFEEQSADFVGYEDKPFVEFLKSQKLTSNIQHYIIHAIAMVDESCSTLQGLKATQKFLLSLGRYGNSPFLCTCYGSAELPQCFCRLCAVYEGMYYLKRQVDGIFTDQENKCTGIISRGQRIDCEWIVMESTYAPVNYYTLSNPQRISRAILISDASIYPSEKERLPPTSGMKSAVTVLEFNSKNYVCPEDLYLVYMCCRSSNATASEDLKEAVELLFTTENTDIVDDKQNQKPKLLWSVYFNQLDTSTINLDEDCPTAVFLTSNPDLDLDYEHAVKQAHEIFEAMYPGEEFLPRAPDPEDILIEMHNNPGDEGECGKIENDVSSMDGDGENNTADEDGENNTADKDGENNIADEDGDQNAQESSEAIANDEN
ncbi:rab proteins geranylgeranyltransferase component A 2 [Caerostris extrusa]|uniref:Rab proteins geranylgeranyltransferase component A 2 n=1 Tax=Caerostris extrusa TaxID=172846 RepID=A0AAV4MUI2_CAEEX|nr:rab proteins geranylgeranyltransferase component A 2 [Caerostris extrusa]